MTLTHLITKILFTDASMFRLRNIVFVCFVLLLSSCAHRAQKWIKKKIIPDTSFYRIALNKKVANDSISVLYTGCGGLVIIKGEEALMTDPYYTGHQPWNLLSQKLDKKNTDSVVKRIKQIGDPKDIKTVMISHAHYDHLQDLPYLLEHKLLADTVNIIADQTAQCVLNTFTNTVKNIISSDTCAYDQIPKPPMPVKWIQVSPHIRVLVIEADHAPHYHKIHLMRGKNCRKPIQHPEDRSSIFRWREGRTFSFLVDVMDEQNKTTLLRMFIQSSSCKPPYGFPPAAVINEKAVDVAFLCVASSDYVKPYPKDILELLRPEKIVLIHWEDFFRNFYQKKQKTVRATKMRRFMRHLRQQYKVRTTEELTKWFIMPKPGTEVKLKY